MTGCRTMLEEYSFLCRRPLNGCGFVCCPLRSKFQYSLHGNPPQKLLFCAQRGAQWVHVQNRTSCLSPLLAIWFQESHILLSLGSWWSCEDVWNALSSITGPSQSFRMTSKKKNEKQYEGCFFWKKRFSLAACLIQINDLNVPETSLVEGWCPGMKASPWFPGLYMH